MIGLRTAEVVNSFQYQQDDWECVKIMENSVTFTNSPVILSIWAGLLQERPRDLLAFYHILDKSCLLFRKSGGEFYLLPALFTLDLTITILERINDVVILKKLERLAAQSGKLAGVFLEIK